MRVQLAAMSTILVYALLVLIWATTPLAVVWTVAEIHPFWALFLRYSLASLLFVSILVCMRVKLPLHRQAFSSYLAGSLNVIGAQFFIYLAASKLSSGLMVLIYAFVPLIAGLLEHFVFKTNSISRPQWLGMLLAFLGLILILGNQAQGAADPIGVVLLLLSIGCYIASMFWVKSLKSPMGPMPQTAGALLLSSLLSCAFLPFIWHDFPVLMPSSQAILALLFTVLMSSIVAMLCYFYLLKRLSASTFALSNVMTPSIAVLCGVLLNDEAMSLSIVVGLFMVMFGIVVYLKAQSLKSA